MSRKKRRGIAGVALAVLALGILTVAEQALAVPQFARRFQTSCVTCHRGFPRLNAFGESFRINGYKLPGGDETLVKEEPIKLGAEGYKKVWPEAVWPGEIPHLPAFGGRVKMQFDRFGEISKHDARTTFDFPKEVELFLAGSMGDRIGFFASPEIEEGEIAVHQAFIQFNDVLSNDWVGELLPENALHVKIGKFETEAVPFSDHRRITITRPLLNGMRAVLVKGAGEGHGHGGGPFALGDPQSGIELLGLIGSHIRYAVGLVNGDSLQEDNNSSKDAFYRLEWKIGGMGFDGSLPGNGEGGLPSAAAVEETSVSVGSFGWFGRTEITTEGSAPVVADAHADEGDEHAAEGDEHAAEGDEHAAEEAAGSSHLTDVDDEDFWLVGFFTKIAWDKLEVRAAVGWGNAEEPFGDRPVASYTDVESVGWYVEGSYNIYPWLIGTLRFGQVHVNGPGPDDERDNVRLTPSLMALIRANLRLVVEYSASLSGADDGEAPDILALLLDYAF